VSVQLALSLQTANCMHSEVEQMETRVNSKKKDWLTKKEEEEKTGRKGRNAH
jgi:hypothetical protein